MPKIKKESPKTSISLPSYKKILGLDLSLTGTGWCSNVEASVATGLIDTAGMEGLKRIDYIVNTIGIELSKGDHKEAYTTLVVMEDFSFASKGSSLFQIAGLGYIVRYKLWQDKINFVLVPPPVLKKFACGKGNADKSLILKEVYKRWGADLTNDNEADAYVLSRIGRALLGWDKDELIAYQKEVMVKVKELNQWP